MKLVGCLLSLKLCGKSRGDGETAGGGFRDSNTAKLNSYSAAATTVVRSSAHSTIAGDAYAHQRSFLNTSPVPFSSGCSHRNANATLPLGRATPLALSPCSFQND